MCTSLSKFKIVLCIAILLTLVSNVSYAETEAEILSGYQSYRLHSFSEGDYQSFKNTAHICEYLEDGNTSDCITVSSGKMNISSVNSGYCGVKFKTSNEQKWAVRFDMTLNEGNACFSVYDGEAGVAATVNDKWLMVSEQTDGTGICRKDRTITTEIGRAYTYIIKAEDSAASIYRRASGTLRYERIAANLKMLSSGEENCINIYSDFIASRFSVDNLEFYGIHANSATVDDIDISEDTDGGQFNMTVVGNGGYAVIGFYSDSELKWCDMQELNKGKTNVSFKNIPTELKEICTHFSVYIWDKNISPCYSKQSFLMTEF